VAGKGRAAGNGVKNNRALSEVLLQTEPAWRSFPSGKTPLFADFL